MASRDEIGILIVEPSDTYQRILVTLLKRLGFTSLNLAANPFKAQVLLQHNKAINVVLTELMLPDPEQGLRFVRQLREKYSAEALPILTLTNHSEKKYVQEAIQAGINGFLIKPIDPDHLEAHLWRLFDLPLRGSQKMGEYLVLHGFLTTEQRDLALRFQKEFTVTPGALALHLGYLSIADLQEWAFVEDEEDFFDLGPGRNLNEVQAQHLRECKNRTPLRLGEILVQFGYLQKDALEQALSQFRAAAPRRNGRP